MRFLLDFFIFPLKNHISNKFRHKGNAMRIPKVFCFTMWFYIYYIKNEKQDKQIISFRFAAFLNVQYR
jgi:hypothetical protein